MSNTDVDFVIGIVGEVKRSGRSFSRELLKDCYLADLKKRGVNEQAIVSEKWIDYYWNRFGNIPYDRLERAASSQQKLTKLLIEVFYK